MHVQTSIQVVETVLLQVFVEERVAVRLSIHAVVPHYVRIQLQSTCTCGVILCIRAIAGPWITLSNIAHMHILVHHAAVGPVRRVDHVAWKQRAFIQISSGAWHTDRLLSGGVKLDHHSAVHLRPVHIVDTLHIYQVLVLSLNS